MYCMQQSSRLFQASLRQGAGQVVFFYKIFISFLTPDPSSEEPKSMACLLLQSAILAPVFCLLLPHFRRLSSSCQGDSLTLPQAVLLFPSAWKDPLGRGGRSWRSAMWRLTASRHHEVARNGVAGERVPRASKFSLEQQRRKLEGALLFRPSWCKIFSLLFFPAAVCMFL